MKIIFFIVFFACIYPSMHAMEKPVFITGTRTSSYFNTDGKTVIFPSTVRDAVYISLSEEINDIFTFKCRTEFDYTSFNKYAADIEDLSSISLDNCISLYFNFLKYSSILLYAKPGYRYQSGEKYFNDSNLIQYKLSMKYFSFVTYYSNRFYLKKSESVSHKMNVTVFWCIPKSDYLKFKSSFSVVLQHTIYDQDKKITPLNSLNFSFEMAVDFNKMDFDQVFKSAEPEDENY